MEMTVPATNWIYPEEQAEVVRRLLEWQLLKFDNGRRLPLKNGGFTDIYINLRDARNAPAAIDWLADIFAEPLRHLHVDRFCEVPDSVSGIAGALSARTSTPYLTVRAQEKAGRVSDAKIIGEVRQGDRVVIVDDVVTDGASKIPAIRECLRRGAKVVAVLVLVDRQQGWQKTFAEQDISVPVWSGMMLHDVRRHLIQTLGVMERHTKEAEEKNPIIVALDGKSWDEILPIIDRLRTFGCILKVNDLLLQKGIEWILPNLSVYGRVMADLKGHDIPATVKNIARHFRACPPWAVTVHASGQEKMIRMAVDTLAGLPTIVLGVTLLTSLDERDCEEVYVRKPLEQVLRLAAIAVNAGAGGLVSSPQEVEVLRGIYPNVMLVTPGIRSAGMSHDDQKRVDTPSKTRSNGADCLVMGRQITGADDPVAEVRRVLEEELDIHI